jgi:predicted transcriptional regulator
LGIRLWDRRGSACAKVKTPCVTGFQSSPPMEDVGTISQKVDDFMRRDRLKILIGILEICDENGANKTKIVYGANINFKVAGMYLDMLINEGLVEVINPGTREKYLATEKGREMLGSIKQVYDRMEQYSLE